MARECDDWRHQSTQCVHAGGPCAPGLQLARLLAASVDLGCRSIPEGFQLTGTALVCDCGRPCALTFRVEKSAAWVLGDIDQGADCDALVRFAQGFFGDGPGLYAVPTAIPAAMVRASRRPAADVGHAQHAIARDANDVA